jgi:hypothetical protein
VAGSGQDDRSDTNKRRLQEPCVCVTTFNMIAHKGKRSAYGEEVRACCCQVSGCLQSVLLCSILFYFILFIYYFYSSCVSINVLFVLIGNRLCRWQQHGSNTVATTVCYTWRESY